MSEHELWITALFNEHLAGFGNAVLRMVGMETSARPWVNYITLQFVVLIVMVVLFALLRPRLSMDKPGGMQQIFELIYKFVRDQSEEIVGHDGPKFLHFFASIFIVILFANLLGVLPYFESPTMFAPVPLGFALGVFLYYHIAGVKAHGFGRYLATFAGPMPVLAPIMIPIELISHCGRLLSLTVRLFANMFASENVFLIFVGLVPIFVPMIFLGEHIFKALLQAYVFVLLAMVYVQGAIAHEH